MFSNYKYVPSSSKIITQSSTANSLLSLSSQIPNSAYDSRIFCTAAPPLHSDQLRPVDRVAMKLLWVKSVVILHLVILSQCMSHPGGVSVSYQRKLLFSQSNNNYPTEPPPAAAEAKRGGNRWFAAPPPPMVSVFEPDSDPPPKSPPPSCQPFC
ncbi:hypothetical protein AAHA92_30126 [Salvia divinorum]|uniref:Uncharacterized protein n=1 Tax=Salvia divinorum TaxID=28513 RepID=A0ABD1G0M5_SALDI